MKKGIFITLIVMFSVSFIYGQLTFGVSPGIGFNSAYFGFKVKDKFVPYISIQYLNASTKYEESGQRFDYDLYQIVSYTETDEFKLNLFIPDLGLKYFIKQQNTLKAYLSLNLSKPFISGKQTYEGEEDEDFNEYIKNMRIWGGEFGFGIEYFFDENFSFGGEFGLRYIHYKYKDSYEYEIYNPDTDEYQDVTIEESYKFNTSPTYSKISLNYYFSGNK